MHYVYITTNLINKKYYIGKHKGEVNDSYLGSGVILKQAIEKYGKDNFQKEILVICSTEEEVNHWERTAIQEHLSNPDCYNIAPGGEGGYTIKYFSEEEKQKVRQKASKSYKQYTTTHPEEVKARQDKQRVSLLSNIESHRKAVREGLLARSEKDKQAQHEKITQKKLENGYYSEFHLIDPEGNKVFQSIGAENIAKKYGVTPNGIRLASKHRQPISRGILKGYKVEKVFKKPSK